MLFDSPFAGPVVARHRSILADSILASSLDHATLLEIERAGEIVSIPSGTVVFEESCTSDHLYVVLDGALLPASGLGTPDFWVGPGDVCGEGGFVTGAPRRRTMVAFGPDPRFFRLHRDALSHLADPRGTAMTRLLGALSRTLAARAEPRGTASSRWTERDYCDQDHPAVAAMARSLDRGAPLATACAIWSALWRMPYRFGSWRWSASDTIARGHGMCTTKAVLQVALMRALGLECGYVRGDLDGPLVRACMPRAYGPRFQRPNFRHYYGAVRVEGRWIPLDASFSRGSLGLIAERERHVEPFVGWDAATAGHVNGAATLGGTDPYAIEVCSDIEDVMGKTATYDAKNADAMNVLLDRAQGYAPPVAEYVGRMREALDSGAALRARTLVMEGLHAEVGALRRAEAGR